MALEERREARRLADVLDGAEHAETPRALPMPMARRPRRRCEDPDQLNDARLNGDAPDLLEGW